MNYLNDIRLFFFFFTKMLFTLINLLSIHIVLFLKKNSIIKKFKIHFLKSLKSSLQKVSYEWFYTIFFFNESRNPYDKFLFLFIYLIYYSINILYAKFLIDYQSWY